HFLVAEFEDGNMTATLKQSLSQPRVIQSLLDQGISLLSKNSQQSLPRSFFIPMRSQYLSSRAFSRTQCIPVPSSWTRLEVRELLPKLHFEVATNTSPSKGTRSSTTKL